MAQKAKVKSRKRIKKVIARYTAIIERDEETGQYCVTVPALPGCITQGDTLEEAIANAEECIQGFIATLHDLGKPIPMEILVEAEVEVR
ncbi:MAG: type II toxin-antitoxin system HicB family antitoxin [Armatimonadetes bacterium]|nr:type II toxin-antitoxin system HicB family antitoxin [Armatimonadota bacterium]MDW8028146.1 type II toxin-antitoxin system HicB family antitoxin [Armatimonadota bacterium]